MKFLSFSILSMVTLFISCSNASNNKNSAHSVNIETTLNKEISEVKDNLGIDTEDSKSKSLNDIRFEGWDSEDWLDNDYIRALRVYFDDYSEGKIINQELDPYKKYIKGKFIIADIEPYMLGGAFIRIIFLDLPTRIFESWVYSDVNEEKEIVTGYEVRGVHIDKEVYDFKKEEILETMKEHPELKAW